MLSPIDSVRLYHSRILSIEHLGLRFPSVTSEECAPSNDILDKWIFFPPGWFSALVQEKDTQPSSICFYREP